MFNSYIQIDGSSDDGNYIYFSVESIRKYIVIPSRHYTVYLTYLACITILQFFSVICAGVKRGTAWKWFIHLRKQENFLILKFFKIM
jgi:hypothetical protein